MVGERGRSRRADERPNRVREGQVSGTEELYIDYSDLVERKASQERLCHEKEELQQDTTLCKNVAATKDVQGTNI